MNSLTIVIPPHWVTGFLGIYVVWTIITLFVFTDWFRENKDSYWYIGMSLGEKMNYCLWFVFTIIFIIIVWSQ